MFTINQSALPFVQTRQALLVLDLQNDLVSPTGSLRLRTPSGFVERTVNLANEFRASGKVIWIRSQFEASRPVDGSGGDCETVITDHEVQQGMEKRSKNARRRALSTRLGTQTKELEANERQSASDAKESSAAEKTEEDARNETFLTVASDKHVQAVQRDSPGAEFCQEVLASVAGNNDLIFQKSYYSAFKDGSLVQILRGQFVTEIYICGALTNISVFATAMDAARHGYSITLVEDCLGYGNKSRHDEAIRRLKNFTGCDTITSDELIQFIQPNLKPASRGTARRKSSSSRRENLDLETSLANLNLGSEALELAESLRKEAGVEGMPRERVKTKIRTRRRPKTDSEKTDKDKIEEGAEKPEKPPTAGKRSPALPVTPPLQTAPSPPRMPPPPLADEGVAGSDMYHLDADLEENGEANLTPDVDVGKEVEKNDAESEKLNATQPDSPELHDKAIVHESSAEPTAAPVPLCEGDTTVMEDLLPVDLAVDIFEKLRDEIRWQKMSHQGGDVPRLVAVQGEIGEDGSIPIYRHPADESPPLHAFSPTVLLIKKHVEEKVGHPVNHVLIQFYRTGVDYISEHSDKTLDIVPNTFIANVSLGAQRTMTFRTKKPLKHSDVPEASEPLPRQSCRAPLPHNSLCRMGLATNMRWLHSIRQDKRMASEKSEAELAYDGGRISLTFRQIGTFLDRDQSSIWGQGATSKTKEGARHVINGDTEECKEMILAFGKENHSSDFDWQDIYGTGFDVLHISNTRKLFLSGDNISDSRVKIMLAEYGLEWTEAKLSPPFNWDNGSGQEAVPPVPEALPIKLVDNDPSHSIIEGDLAILLYLDANYSPKSDRAPKSQATLARQFSRLFATDSLIKKWRESSASVRAFRHELDLWDSLAAEGEFIAGSAMTIADFALWPVVNAILDEFSSQKDEWKNLRSYHERVKKHCALALMPAELEHVDEEKKEDNPSHTSNEHDGIAQ